MKIGDLVQLSAKGKSIKANRKYLGAVGIVMQVWDNGYYDYGVRFFPKKGIPRNKVTWFKRYELKKCKAVKKCP